MVSACLEPKAHRELRVRRGLKALALAVKAHKDRRGQLELKAHRGFLVLRDRLAHKVARGQPAYREARAV